MTFAKFKHEILSSATEDLRGAYEAWWTANTWYPRRPVSERLAFAERALRELVDEGLVVLCRGTWETAEGFPVPPEERETVLTDWATWAIPEGPRVFFFASEAGERRYYGEVRVTPPSETLSPVEAVMPSSSIR